MEISEVEMIRDLYLLSTINGVGEKTMSMYIKHCKQSGQVNNKSTEKIIEVLSEINKNCKYIKLPSKELLDIAFKNILKQDGSSFKNSLLYKITVFQMIKELNTAEQVELVKVAKLTLKDGKYCIEIPQDIEVKGILNKKLETISQRVKEVELFLETGEFEVNSPTISKTSKTKTMNKKVFQEYKVHTPPFYSKYTFGIAAMLELPGYGRKTVSKMLKYISPNMVLEVNDAESLRDLLLYIKDKLSNVKIPEMYHIEKAVKRSKEIERESKANQVGCVTIFDRIYPSRLRGTEDFPLVLYYKGDYSCVLDDKLIAVIGTRNPTEYGAKFGFDISSSLSKNSVVIVSGLAEGCDSQAHKGAVENKGKTIGIMAGGLHSIYPASNYSLAIDILEHDGCLISEYPYGVKANRSTFVDRDRLQSGVSAGIIVVETDIKGGTMHTVGFAKAQGRFILALNHPESELANKQSRGTQMLISQGTAQPVDDSTPIEYITNLVKSSEFSCENNSRGFCDEEQLKLEV